MKVVHYLNQFFAGVGGEEAADAGPSLMPGPQGPGKGVGFEIATTLVCGDNFFAEHEDEAVSQLIRWIKDEAPDVLMLGPAFGSGRYGYACGILAREAVRLGVPSVSGMHPDNPGVTAAEGAAYIYPAKQTVAGMREVLPKMADLSQRLAAGAPVGSAQEEGYLPRGLRGNELESCSGAERAMNLLLQKLAGQTESEIAPVTELVPPPPPVVVADSTIAVVTEAGCVPRGNPDHLSSVRGRSWHEYSLDGLQGLSAETHEIVHGGFDVLPANRDPNRLVPIDALRALESAGVIGRLHGSLFTTTGNGTPVAAARRFGQEIASELKSSGVQAALLTGT
jgi:betaine reductase